MPEEYKPYVNDTFHSESIDLGNRATGLDWDSRRKVRIEYKSGGKITDKNLFSVIDVDTNARLKDVISAEISFMGHLPCYAILNCIDSKLNETVDYIHTFVYKETVQVVELTDSRRDNMATPVCTVTKNGSTKPTKTMNGKAQNTMSSGKKGK